MKLRKYIYGVALGALTLSFASCYNSDKEFPDYEGGTTAYFAYQNPVRTLILGNDIYDNTLDNEHKCKIWSTMGGAYNGRDAYVEIAIDNSLCNDLYFVDAGGNRADAVMPLPADYYSLSSTTIPYNGDLRGNVEIHFTDKFFNDPKSIENTYVIPLVMKSVVGLDSILVGKTREGVVSPVRTNPEQWEVLPKDYVLYCVKYMNPWQGRYIRRGVDKVTEGDNTVTIIRKDTTLVNTDLEHYKENPINAKDQVCSIKTKNMNQALFDVSFKKANGNSEKCTLLLTFNGNKCDISTITDGVTATGSGELIEKGTQQEEYKDYQWGSNNGQPVHRDILRMSYNVEFGGGMVKVETNDTLVVQTRESNKKEFFSTMYYKP